MKMPSFTLHQFFAYLKKFGFEVKSNEFWNDFDRVIVDNGKDSFPIQIQEIYFYPTIFRLSEKIRIPLPDELQNIAENFEKYYNNIKTID